MYEEKVDAFFLFCFIQRNQWIVDKRAGPEGRVEGWAGPDRIFAFGWFNISDTLPTPVFRGVLDSWI